MTVVVLNRFDDIISVLVIRSTIIFVWIFVLTIIEFHMSIWMFLFRTLAIKMKPWIAEVTCEHFRSCLSALFCCMGRRRLGNVIWLVYYVVRDNADNSDSGYWLGGFGSQVWEMKKSRVLFNVWSRAVFARCNACKPMSPRPHFCFPHCSMYSMFQGDMDLFRQSGFLLSYTLMQSSF